MSEVRKARKKRGPPPDPRLPQERFLPLVERVNRLIKYHEKTWPDGVNPQSFLTRHVDPIVRWYNSGERGYDMLKKIEGLIRLLEVSDAPE